MENENPGAEQLGATMRSHLDRRERLQRSLLLPDWVWTAHDDALLTSREVALIISPERPNITTVSMLKTRELLKAVQQNPVMLRYRAADVRAISARIGECDARDKTFLSHSVLSASPV